MSLKNPESLAKPQPNILNIFIQYRSTLLRLACQTSLDTVLIAGECPFDQGIKGDVTQDDSQRRFLAQ